ACHTTRPGKPGARWRRAGAARLAPRGAGQRTAGGALAARLRCCSTKAYLPRAATLRFLPGSDDARRFAAVEPARFEALVEALLPARFFARAPDFAAGRAFTRALELALVLPLDFALALALALVLALDFTTAFALVFGATFDPDLALA